MLPEAAAFRHDPVKYVLAAGPSEPVRWASEPAVCGYRKLSYQNAKLGTSVAVPLSATPAIVAGVGVIAASDDGYVRFFDRSLQKVYWERRLDSSIYASLVVDTVRRNIIVAATSGLVVCLDLRGRLVWAVQTGAPIYATPVVVSGPGILFVAAFNSRCLGLDLATGSVVFDRPVPRPWHASQGGSASYRDPYASPSVTMEDAVILCCAEHALCLAPDGTELWRYEIGHAVKASPAVSHAMDQVAVCPVNGTCLFFDTRTGQLRGEVFLGAKITGSPAVSGDVLAVGTQRDEVVGLDARTHEVMWSSPQGAPRSYTSLTVLPDGNFVATSAKGNVFCLQRHDGRFLWESSQVLGLPDHEPEMDITPAIDPHGSMYCASYSGFLYHFRFRPTNGKDPSCR